MYEMVVVVGDAVMGKILGLSRLRVVRRGTLPCVSAKVETRGVTPVTEKWTFLRPKP